MFKNLLFPTDGTAFGSLALPLAIRLAHAFRARLHIVRVHYSTPATPDLGPHVRMDETLREWELQNLNVLVEQAENAGVAATSELLEGPVAAALDRYADAMGIDLVVMATHGRGGIQRAILGSVAEGLLRRVQIPVLLVHARSEETDVPTNLAHLKRIVVALDGSPEAEAILPFATAIARVCSAELVLMQAAVPIFEVATSMLPATISEAEEALGNEAAEYLRQVAARQGASLAVRGTVVNAVTAADGILRCARDEDADLIAMSTHGRRGWSRIALGSIAESVLRRSDVPVLLLPHAEVMQAG